MATKHTYTATAQDGTVHTRTTARTYTHCILATGIHHAHLIGTPHDDTIQYGRCEVLGWAGSPELAAKRVATDKKYGFLNVQAVPCTVN